MSTRAGLCHRRCHWMLILLLASVGRADGGEPTAVADPDPQRFREAIDQFAADDRQVARGHVDTLFVGSSSIRLWDLETSFPERGYLNRGFGGAETSDLLHYAQQVVFRYQPRRVVYFCGVNDIAHGKSPQRVLRDFQQFVARFQSACPDARLIVLAHKPSPARARFLPQVREANQLFADFIAAQKRIQFVQATFDALIDRDGNPIDSLFVPDGIHMTDEGYALWTERVRPVLDLP